MSKQKWNWSLICFSPAWIWHCSTSVNLQSSPHKARWLVGHDWQATSQFPPTRAPPGWSSSVLLPGSLGWPRRRSEALGGWWWCPWKVTRAGNGPDICEWQSGAAASGRHPETETRWRPPTDPGGEYIQSVRMIRSSARPRVYNICFF